jgi:glycosyltransferase involved in cell wall biosynthesis
MKLLITTQSVDLKNPVLGFFHEWIKQFSFHFEKVTVLCLNKGDCNLPKNVEVVSLGKDSKVPRIKILLNFLSFVIFNRKLYDKVFVHMNPIYVVLGGIFWRFFDKEVFLWYSHKNVDWKLKFATFFSNKVFSTSKEGFSLKNQKGIFVGHGIDDNLFSEVIFKSFGINKKIIISSISRISEVKNLEALILTARKLKELSINFEINVWGDVLNDRDKAYKLKLEKYIDEGHLNSSVYFRGFVPYEKILTVLNDSDITVNLSSDGGMDKVVLESLLSMRPTFFSNKAFLDIYGDLGSKFHFKDGNDLALKIVDLLKRGFNEDDALMLREVVKKRYNLSSLIQKIANYYGK